MDCSHYFQSISGLDEVYTSYAYDGINNTDFKPYKGNRENKIKITTLEAIDMKMTQLFSMY